MTIALDDTAVFEKSPPVADEGPLRSVSIAMGVLGCFEHAAELGATAVAAEGWQAEVLSKAAFLAGPVDGLTQLREAGAEGLVVDDEGTVFESAGLHAFVATAAPERANA